MSDYNLILKAVRAGLRKFLATMPTAQSALFNELLREISGLETDTTGNIKATVKNMQRLASIKNKINRVILTDEYKRNVKDFAETFNQVTRLQNDYWRSVESSFKPSPLLREIRQATISDVVGKLTDAGIGANVGDRITDILRTNITTGGSYAALADQLKDGLLNTEQKGYLDRYAGQVARDSLNLYSAQYLQVVASDLGYLWYVYDNTDIETTRPFCDHMTDQPYFHLCQIPDFLKGKTTTGQVPIYDKTGLPHGMIPGTDASNFLTRRGGYNCGHQCRPVPDRLVPLAIRTAVYSSPAYEIWARKNGAPAVPPPPAPPKPRATQPKPPKLTVKAQQVIQQAANTYVPVKTKNEARTRMDNVVTQANAWAVDKVSVPNDMTIDQINRAIEAATALFNEYESAYPARQKINIKFSGKSGAYGYVERTTNRAGETNLVEVAFGNPNRADSYSSREYKPPELLGQDADGKDVYEVAKLRPKSRVDEDKLDISTLTHEFGHVIINSVHSTDPRLTAAQRQFLSDLQTLRLEYSSKIKELHDKKDYKRLYEYHLGAYASHNLNEFLAEAWTEYKLSSNPSPMAKKVGALIDKTFKRKK